MDQGVTNIIIVVLVAACIWLFILWRNSRKMDDTINLVAQQHDLIRNDERARRLCRAIHILNPDFTIGVDYFIGLDSPEQEPYIAEWMSSSSRPTEKEINSALLEISDIHHDAKYAAMRRTEYPSVEEQLDAAYQARQGNDAKQLEVDEKIRSVKEKYPKTDECI
jgi:signal transduction histidine kinase